MEDLYNCLYAFILNGHFVFLQAFAVITGDAVQLRMHVPFFEYSLDISLEAWDC